MCIFFLSCDSLTEDSGKCVYCFSRDAILISKFSTDARLRCLRRIPISSRLLFDARIVRLCSNLRHFIARAKVRIKNIAYISRSSGSLCGRATIRSPFPRSSALPNDNYYRVMIVTRDAFELNPFSPYANVSFLRF